MTSVCYYWVGIKFIIQIQQRSYNDRSMVFLYNGIRIIFVTILSRRWTLCSVL